MKISPFGAEIATDILDFYPAKPQGFASP